MIRIDMIRSDTRHLDKRRRHQGRATERARRGVEEGHTDGEAGYKASTRTSDSLRGFWAASAAAGATFALPPTEAYSDAGEDGEQCWATS